LAFNSYKQSRVRERQLSSVSKSPVEQPDDDHCVITDDFVRQLAPRESHRRCPLRHVRSANQIPRLEILFAFANTVGAASVIAVDNRLSSSVTKIICIACHELARVDVDRNGPTRSRKLPD